MPAAQASKHNMTSRPRGGRRPSFLTGPHAGTGEMPSSTGSGPAARTRPVDAGTTMRTSARSAAEKAGICATKRSVGAMAKTIADLLVDTLVAQGVERIYGVAG